MTLSALERNKPIVVSGVNAVIFHAREKFHRTTELENPFRKDSDWYANITEYTHYPNGAVSIKHVPPKDPDIRPATQAEKDAWNKAENEFIAEVIFEKCGWDHYEWWCDEHSIEKTHVPCDFDGQCEMWCVKFGRCSKS